MTCFPNGFGPIYVINNPEIDFDQSKTNDQTLMKRLRELESSYSQANAENWETFSNDDLRIQHQKNNGPRDKLLLRRMDPLSVLRIRKQRLHRLLCYRDVVQVAANGDQKCALIIEENFAFPEDQPNFQRLLDRAWKHIPTECNILFLSAFNAIGELNESLSLIHCEAVYRVRAMIVFDNYFQKLTKLFDDNLANPTDSPVVPIDNLWNQILNSKKGEFYALNPFLEVDREPNEWILGNSPMCILPSQSSIKISIKEEGDVLTSSLSKDIPKMRFDQIDHWIQQLIPNVRLNSISLAAEPIKDHRMVLLLEHTKGKSYAVVQRRDNDGHQDPYRRLDSGQALKVANEVCGGQELTFVTETKHLVKLDNGYEFVCFLFNSDCTE